MLSNGFETHIRVDPVSSKLYLYFVFVTHALAIFALIYPSSLPVWLRSITGVCVIMSGIYHARSETHSKHWRWIWQRSGEWKTQQDNYQYPWRIQRIFSLTKWFVAIRLSDDLGRRENLLLFCDQLDAQSFRRLRVRLQYAQVDAANPGETI